MTCAMRYDEPRLVWTSLPITHEIHLRHIVVVVSIVLLQLVPSLNIKLFNSHVTRGWVCTPVWTGILAGAQLTLSRHYWVGIWHGGVLGVQESLWVSDPLLVRHRAEPLTGLLQRAPTGRPTRTPPR